MLVNIVIFAKHIRQYTALLFRAIHTKRHIYAEYQNVQTELYDLVNDPYELENKANNAYYRVIKEELSRKLKRLKNCAGKNCTLTGEKKGK